jgi:hypothetical protein
MLTHTFESSTSEYHQSTIHSDEGGEESQALTNDNREKRKKARKLRNIMREVNKKKKVNIAEERNQLILPVITSATKD